MCDLPTTIQRLTARIQGIEWDLKKKHTDFFSEAKVGNKETATNKVKKKKKDR